MEQNKVTILNLSFNNYTKKEFINFFLDRISNNKKTFIVTANPEIVMYAKQTPSYRRIIEKADYMVPDGVGVIKGAQFLGTPLRERVPGYELMISLLEEADKQKMRVYFLGAKEATLQKVIKNCYDKFPNMIIVGSHHGYFNLSDSRIMDNVRSSNADIIFVALGFPRQELWIDSYMKTSSKGLLMGVGGSFDVLAGNTKRAPQFFLDHNLEWFYRLVSQPQRIIRMVALPKFLIAIYKQKRQK